MKVRTNKVQTKAVDRADMRGGNEQTLRADMTARRIFGKLIGERAVQAGIKAVVFDRGGYVYTGRVAEVAAGAREAGLDF